MTSSRAASARAAATSASSSSLPALRRAESTAGTSPPANVVLPASVCVCPNDTGVRLESSGSGASSECSRCGSRGRSSMTGLPMSSSAPAGVRRGEWVCGPSSLSAAGSAGDLRWRTTFGESSSPTMVTLERRRPRRSDALDACCEKVARDVVSDSMSPMPSRLSPSSSSSSSSSVPPYDVRRGGGRGGAAKGAAPSPSSSSSEGS
mmetsp:Transcript_48518/g.149771  ORF Transcript_48518/g.149771 Transcript_48518/m.149771 type:complete len:206 (+) Transcript_48518:204-821(+)